ncbi:unnamed protein product [Bemisia tabaci]|uniref:GOLD domain-containing protein n=1 Tax=Bemisia tabaci TaxID=7038 RepID=A0A9P0CCY6_BEMTA|nr:unnamed protein product [Bemisia tabaci]
MRYLLLVYPLFCALIKDASSLLKSLLGTCGVLSICLKVHGDWYNGKKFQDKSEINIIDKIHLTALNFQALTSHFDRAEDRRATKIFCINSCFDSSIKLDSIASPCTAQKEKENEEKAEAERLRLEEEKQKKNEEEKLKQEAQRRLIQEELNQQTFTQFKSYAEQQYPGNPEQQAVLVRQLQDQHYHLYMQKILHNDNKVGVETNPLGVPNLGNSTEESPSETQSEGDTETIPTMQPASMWTRKDVKEFKESIRKEGGDAIIKVGHGETVTVRVPTHEDGSCLFWEFATDNYDIGFGVYFEWGKSESNQVSVHVSESEDDEDLEDEEEDDDFMDEPRGDSEMGLHRLNNSRLLNNRPPMSIIIPVYRRDCQDEVYTGSHQYPGQGVYLLKFDNSYSLWRSKTLYYRIYYTH